MKKQSAITKARAAYLETVVGYDRIIESYDAGSFTEFVISMGGDVMTYRVYGNTSGSFAAYAR